MVLAPGSHLMDIHGVGPVVAARILADVGDVDRFPDRNHFASWTGTRPHRCVLRPTESATASHVPGTGGGTNDVPHGRDQSSCASTPPAVSTTDASVAEGKKSMAAMRCLQAENLRRGLPPAHRRPPHKARGGAGGRAREGTPGRLCHAAQPAFPRAPALRISHFPDPHTRRSARRHTSRQPLRVRTGAAPRQRARGVNVERPFFFFFFFFFFFPPPPPPPPPPPKKKKKKKIKEASIGDVARSWMVMHSFGLVLRSPPWRRILDPALRRGPQCWVLARPATERCRDE